MLKSPSQISGLALGCIGLSPVGIRGGRVCLSFLRGSAGGCERAGGIVGRGLVGWGSLSGGPEERERDKGHQTPNVFQFLVIFVYHN